MEIIKFLTSMLPSFTKNTVQNDVEIALEEYQNFVQPSYESFLEGFSDFKFKSNYGKDFENRFDNTFKSNYSTNFIVASYKMALVNLPAHSSLVLSALGDNIKSDVVKAALNMRQLTIVQLADVVSFVTRYARRILNFIITCETNYLTRKPEEGDFKAGEIKYLKDNFSHYVVGLNFLSMPPSDAKTSLDKIPEILVTVANADEATMMAGRDADPFQLNFIPVKLNPFYHVGMRVAEYQAARYHEAKDEQQAISAKILYLQKKTRNEDDAKLEQVIERYEALRAKKTYEIAKMEEKYV